ncbi:RecX family transcriptional regulator [Shewanella sp. Choline-02u-19]|uniref:RecX family transcriptional regulator n=1 Tax=unclassified Shewanella TaxID=196818 RepID=UPI000C3482A9|nr:MULTISPECIES: RecX family transcriptional regulator [unclassified Shewanella]PKG58195.1 RecX family transcriptional regulator [Shewanella sp. GutDb-MelDb]PKG74248.1 RecX family transcriptional regulator [Shewanella sp. GutCb]PKH55901.1 RecX family transcriptional regulator [Shewanella sp. Bg11-22]PKI27347.1 RecX family transcriptional regulator [Shewanella sp. Choline-02u-19]
MQRQPLRQAKTIDNVFNSAYWHLGQQDFTINEIRTKLERKTENQEWIDIVLAKLIENEYLKNDFDFAVRYCEVAFSNELGKGAIRRKLQLRGVPVTDIDTAIEQVMDEQKVDAFEMATSRLLSKFDNFYGTNKEKVYTQMTTKGFSRVEIDHALSQHPERETLRSKLAVKADKVDLTTEIIKLFNKGKGETLILQELKQRLIDVSDFEDTVYKLTLSEDVDFYQSCKKELAKKRYDLSDYKGKSKAYAYLSRKGFGSDEIKEAMNPDDD